ncbi:hypothetical protein HK096_011106, partial [Nowakowskiella sp. JEL0078]
CNPVDPKILTRQRKERKKEAKYALDILSFGAFPACTVSGLSNSEIDDDLTSLGILPKKPIFVNDNQKAVYIPLENEKSDSSLNLGSPVVKEYTMENNNSSYSNDLPVLTRTTQRSSLNITSTQHSLQYTATQTFPSPHTQSFHSQSFPVPNNISPRHLHNSNSKLSSTQPIYSSSSSAIQFSSQNPLSGFLPPVYPSSATSHIPFLTISSVPTINNSRQLSNLNVILNPSRKSKTHPFSSASDLTNSFTESSNHGTNTSLTRPELSTSSKLYSTPTQTSSYQSITLLPKTISSVQDQQQHSDPINRNVQISEEKKYIVYDRKKYNINDWVTINDLNNQYRGRMVKITNTEITIESTDGSKTKFYKADLENRKVMIFS